MTALPHLDGLDRETRALCERFQRDFPLLPRPFAEIAQQIGLTEAEVLDRIRALSASGAISRVGAVVRPHAAGASTLAAVAAPPTEIKAIADIISSFEGVNHNYERDHRYNLWFVITARTQADVAATIADIERRTGLPVLDLPLVRSYHIDLGFPLYAERRAKPEHRPLSGGVGQEDRRLLAALEPGVPPVERPFAAIAERLELPEQAVISRIDSLLARGVITRFGLIVRHRAFGYVANAMAVWDVADESLDDIANGFAAAPGVTLCYARPRRAPHWRYNLFTMIHSRDRASAIAVIERLAKEAGPPVASRDVLFSLRCFKQRGAIYSGRNGVAA